MGLQLSGSINVTGSFNTTAPGVYSGSGFYTSMVVSGSLEDSEGNTGNEGMIFSVDKNNKAKWITGNNISNNVGEQKPTNYDFNIVWEGGLVFKATAISLPILDINYQIDETTLTLSTADPTNPRFDLIVATTQSDSVATFNVIEGTPATNPFYPNYDPNTQISLKYILVRAGATDAADGGDGTADNGDGTNNTDDIDEYPTFSTRMLWNGNTPFYSVGYDAILYRRNGSDGIDLLSSSPVPYFVTNSLSDRVRVTRYNYDTSQNKSGAGSFVIAQSIVARVGGSYGWSTGTGQTWHNKTSLYSQSQLYNRLLVARLFGSNTFGENASDAFNMREFGALEFFVKLQSSTNTNYKPVITAAIQTIQNNNNFDLRNSYEGKVRLEHNVNIDMTDTTSWQRVVIPSNVFIQPTGAGVTVPYVNKVFIFMEPGVVPYNDNTPTERAAMESVYNSSNSSWYFTDFNVQFTGGTSSEVPFSNNIVRTSQAPPPAYNVSYQN